MIGSPVSGGWEQEALAREDLWTSIEGEICPVAFCTMAAPCRGGEVTLDAGGPAEPSRGPAEPTVVVQQVLVSSAW